MRYRDWHMLTLYDSYFIGYLSVARHIRNRCFKNLLFLSEVVNGPDRAFNALFKTSLISFFKSCFITIYFLICYDDFIPSLAGPRRFLRTGARSLYVSFYAWLVVKCAEANFDFGLSLFSWLWHTNLCAIAKVFTPFLLWFFSCCLGSTSLLVFFGTACGFIDAYFNHTLKKLLV